MSEPNSIYGRIAASGLPVPIHQHLLDQQVSLWQVRALVCALAALVDREENQENDELPPCDLPLALTAIAGLVKNACEQLDPFVVATKSSAHEAEVRP